MGKLENIDFNNIKDLNKSEISILNTIKDRILNGESAYKKGWSNTYLENFNYSTKKSYNGVNALSLAISKDKNSYNSNSWLTFNQMKKINENLDKEKQIHLRKGSKGDKISFPTIYDKTNKKYLSFNEYNELQKKIELKKISLKDIPIIIFSKKEYTVFNGDCFENLDLNFENEFVENLNKSKVNLKDKDLAIKLCEKMNVKLSFRNQNKAFYYPDGDEIVLPKENQFYNTNLFKRTFFHELSHSTGNEKRLNRDLTGDFRSENYAFEEIVAESSSIFLSKKFNFFYDENINISSDYLKNWSDMLIDNPKKIIEAIKMGSIAKEYIVEKYEDIEKDLEISKEIISEEDIEIEEDIELELEI